MPATEAGRGRGAVSGAPGVAEIVLLLATGYACHLYYNLVGHVASLRGVDFGPWLLTPIDRAFPYVPFFVHFYQLAYVAPAVLILAALPALRRDIPFLRRVWFAFLVLLAIHYALAILVPTSARPVRLPFSALGDGLNARLVAFQYRLATEWCAWPSLHVSACWFFYRALARRLPPWRGIYLGWFAGMLVSTAAIRIHYVLDGLTGLIVAETVVRLVLRPGAPNPVAPIAADASPTTPGRLALLAALLAVLLAGLPILMRLTGFSGPLYTLTP